MEIGESKLGEIIVPKQKLISIDLPGIFDAESFKCKFDKEVLIIEGKRVFYLYL